MGVAYLLVIQILAAKLVAQLLAVIVLHVVGYRLRAFRRRRALLFWAAELVVHIMHENIIDACAVYCG